MSKKKKKKVYPKWSLEEDNIVLEAVQYSKENNLTLKSAFESASKKINRTISSITFRWNNKLKFHQKNSKNVSNIKQQEILDYINLLLENKKAYDNLESKYDALLSAHKQLLSDLEINIKKSS